MKRTHLSVVVGALALLSARPAAAEEGLRLRDAIRMALARNERSIQAGQRVDAAEGSVDRARVGFRPSVTVSAGASKSIEPDRRGNSVPISSFAALTVSQPLLNFSTFPQVDQAKRSLEAERATAVDTRRVLAFDTARAFLQALTAEQMRRSAEQRHARAKANLQNAQARAEAGLASVNDATRARLDVSSAARDVATSLASEQRAMLSLAFVIGEATVGPLAPTDSMTQSAETFRDDGNALATSAVARRPDLRALRSRIDAAAESVRETHYRFAPSLSLSGQVRLTPDATALRYHDETISLSLSWSLYDAGARVADRRTRQAQLEIARLDERYARRGVERDVRVNLVVLEDARLSFKAADEAVAAARQSAEETGILYKQGLARAIELVDANGRLFDAEISLATARLQMNQAYLDVRYALGLDPLDDGGSAR
ncbi:MAG: TolC family protein [Polyangiaceae bacterium]|nr:TolC family protein [Polyangiaceae bacterium]